MHLQSVAERSACRRSPIVRLLSAVALVAVPCLALLAMGSGLAQALGNDALAGGVLPVDRPVNAGDLAGTAAGSDVSKEVVLSGWVLTCASGGGDDRGDGDNDRDDHGRGHGHDGHDRDHGHGHDHGHHHHHHHKSHCD